MNCEPPLHTSKGISNCSSPNRWDPITEEQRHALQVSQQSSSRLEGLIEDLIMVSLASRGEMSIKLDDMDIPRIASLAVKSFMGQGAGTRASTCSAVIDEDVPLRAGRFAEDRLGVEPAHR